MDAATSGGHPSSDLSADPQHAAPGPTVLRIALGGALRRLREEADVSREVAADAIRASTAKISRIETGRVGFKIRDITDLLVLYGVTDPRQCDEFLEVAHQANKPGWWHQYSDLVPAWFETYLGLEQAATVIRTFALQFVPGLLQTPDYARAVTRLAHTDPVEVEGRVRLRTRRQRILNRDQPPKFWAVIDESVLRRPIGNDPDILRGQLEHLLRVCDLNHVTIQIALLDQGGHAAAGGSFTILRLAHSHLPDIVYIEHLTGAQYLDRPTDVEYYTFIMSRLITTIQPPERTPSIIRRILNEV
jgi:hypothetical protein